VEVFDNFDEEWNFVIPGLLDHRAASLNEDPIIDDIPLSSINVVAATASY